MSYPNIKSVGANTLMSLLTISSVGQLVQAKKFLIGSGQGKGWGPRGSNLKTCLRHVCHCSQELDDLTLQQDIHVGKSHTIIIFTPTFSHSPALHHLKGYLIFNWTSLFHIHASSHHNYRV